MFNPNRFEGDGGEGSQESESSPLTETELRAREQELKARYEDPYRKEQAKALWEERKAIRKEEHERIKQIRGTLESSASDSENMISNETKKITEENIFLSSQLAEASQAERHVREKMEARGIFEKLKYRFAQDPLKQEADSLQKEREELQANLAFNAWQIQNTESKWNALHASTKENVDARDQIEKRIFSRKQKKLFEKTHDTNASSREAIRTTFLSMEKGELDIHQLATENNAVVVHGIPLDGWDMRNTSMNNPELEVEKLSAKEKADILLTKQPDISASILSVDRMEGQGMFYPFAYIVDGKLVAAYQGDEGTVASGTSRRRKEKELKGTLQSDAKEKFGMIAHSPAEQRTNGIAHNESIVHLPVLKGVLIDEAALSVEYEKGDIVHETFSSREEEEIRIAEHKDSVVDSSKWMRDELGVEPKTLFMRRKRTAMQKAIEYAQENHPELPIYVRKADSIYTLDGRKVTAHDIYA